MKIALSCLLVVIAAVIAGTNSFASTKAVFADVHPELGSSFATASGKSIAFGKIFVLGQPENSLPDAPKDGAYIQPALDRVMNSSVVPVIGAILCLIAVLCSPLNGLPGSILHSTAHVSLLTVLFRTSIAPNAP
jgi:hypothetical protein